MQENELRLSAYQLFEMEVYDTAFLNFLGLAEYTNFACDWYSVGFAAMTLGGFGKALEMFRKANLIEPSNTNCKAMLALLFAASPVELDRDGQAAVALATEVRSSSAEDSWSLLTILAAAYAEVGAFEDAITTLNTGLTACPEGSRQYLLIRIKQYRNRMPFRLTKDHVRDYLRSLGRCLRCGANISMSRKTLCVRCSINLK